MFRVVLLLLLVVVNGAHGEVGLAWNSPEVEVEESWYTLGSPGGNCLEACWDAGYSVCLSYAGDVDTIIDNLYFLEPEGDISLFESVWSENYHPLVEADNTFVGWDVVPEVAGGTCDAYPPDFTQRRLCRCSDSCEDVFQFCSSLRFVCHKYQYTRTMCPQTCKMCSSVLDSEAGFSP